MTTMTREQLNDRLASLNRRALNCRYWLRTAALDDPRRGRARSDWAGLILEMAEVVAELAEREADTPYIVRAC